MATISRLLVSGPGWSVSDVVCDAGPGDPPFEERHGDACIAAVTQGMFQYRSTQGAALLAPGALLLGNEGDGFECGHDHGKGDRCLAFHFAPDRLEAILAELPVLGSLAGARRMVFTVPRLPPLPRLMPLLVAAEAARQEGDGAALEELAVSLAAAVVATLAGAEPAARRPSRRDERRIVRALRRIEARAQEPLALAELANEAAMSPYHFLRVFRQVAGMTPHQYVLRTRLHRAALRISRSDELISTIAFDAGFNDLASFNRRFRGVMGASPSAYRKRGRRPTGGLL